MAESRSVYLVVGGGVAEGPNPGLTVPAREEAVATADLLPPKPPAVICGTGQRHEDLAKALGLTPTYWTPTIGTPEKFRRGAGTEKVVLGHGTIISRHEYASPEDRSVGVWALLNGLPDGSVVVTSRGTTKGVLGLDHSSQTTVIRIWLNGENRMADYRIFNLMDDPTT
ncbi:MAG: hypothetical protein WC734_03380 [Patescibacteria group bacterium]|jgi:hypothetical protein